MQSSSISIPVDSPLPTKRNALTRLNSHIRFSAVVDVGVREGTGELIEVYGDLRHHLFEPVPTFFSQIGQAYARIDHMLHPLALSDTNGCMYLVSTSLERDGHVTHSAISSKPMYVDGREVVACETIEVRRFDSLDLESQVPDDFLLKIDVDGQDLAVAKGFGSALRKAAAIVIECTVPTMVSRLSYLAEQGFELIDMTDMIYYGPSLYQFDAVLVRRDLVGTGLRPDIGSFARSLWKPLDLDVPTPFS